jgi:hypothetical protein
MAFEKFDQGPYGEGTAHEEANELRFLAGVSPETGKVFDPAVGREREATAEDYENALKNLEDLREIALTSTDWDKTMDALSNNPLTGAPFLARVVHALRGNPAEIGKRWQESEAVVHSELEKIVGKALADLHRLHADGKQFGRLEAEARG